MSSVLAFISAAIRLATPIALATMACTVSELSGVINIGIEGIMTASAFAAALLTFYTGNPWIGLLAAVIAGMAFAGIIVVLSIYCGGDQVVIGIGLNLLGPGLSYLIMSEIWGSRGTSPWLEGFQEINIPILDRIPIIKDIISGYNPCIYLCLLLTIVFHFIVYRTRFGLRMRAAGENPIALQTVGVNVYKLRTRAILLGGALAGVSGASLSIGSLNMFTNGMSANMGFLAFAANRFGQFSPWGSYLTGLLFGAMQALQIRLQGNTIPPQFLTMLPYVVTLIALMFIGKRIRIPAADGVPFSHPISIRYKVKKEK